MLSKTINNNDKVSADERRFHALAEAVREHEQGTSSTAVPKRPRDHALYERLRRLELAHPLDGETQDRPRGIRYPLRGH